MTKKIVCLLISLVLVLMSSCDLLNCTQANVSYLRMELYNTAGNAVLLPDTLTIGAKGTNHVLVNRNVNTKEILLPLSYHAPADTFVLHYYSKYYSLIDTLYVQKSNEVYFESPDCPTVMMHKIQSVSCAGVFLNSVEILDDRVDFDEVVHLKLFVKESN